MSVTVLGMRGHQVRVGIMAPQTVTVHREELYERLRSDRSMRESRRPDHVGLIRETP